MWEAAREREREPGNESTTALHGSDTAGGRRAGPAGGSRRGFGLEGGVEGTEDIEDMVAAGVSAPCSSWTGRPRGSSRCST